ncbi:MAG TPA: phosphoglycerate kinase [Elusimicrobia bacterium]|nr:MAG: phosphoglycerate kinase [Elusimicrobia bacterium RIFOXYA12_FULL_49_49]OGS06109.1 MAG: phosphoglycerate kinase [Elusimicrobia bacterium RIFOXYA1_FULL_47_7]OGS11742.1 MAG: phosphoglycerate kinase [Elusimicrobia bacterium RIFOXYB1_FULL_48_9]OGS16742.1 MAG: phosphoglycerate kinase [Elusimicrobia bacterium RIFOXYA2_FULL_47_53]OGS27023.1 MAG: phosphoglycerate kinase [Elusimicrobia bacterium RIFOXYB12_FULL_50_12]OGS31970.1 MAG: phosphoglycerate kinase [Elusimicrobia bacterium RIFOXYB2_FULL_46
MKKTIKDIELAGKKVLVRVDYNVPLDDKQQITNDKRIVATLPTIKYLLEQKAAVILMSHLGRPKGKVVASMSLKPAAARLGEHLNINVKMAPDCIGAETEKMAMELKSGEVLLLENLRYHPEEEKNDEAFAKKLASLGEVFVQDAFGTVHRAHASTAGIVKFLKTAACGFLVEKELKFLGEALDKPKRPFLAILGGSKVSDKIAVIENLLSKVDSLIIGGAMAYTFLKAEGIETGKSLVEADKVDVARDLIKKAQAKHIKLFIPIDHIIVDKVDFETKKIPADAVIKETEGADIPQGFMGVDVGPMTLQRISPVVNEAATIVWNGPLGVFEIEQFSKGTIEIAKLVAQATEKGATSVIGGGDSVSAVKKAGVDKKVTHISTGGGASLEFLEGKELPGIAALPNK